MNETQSVLQAARGDDPERLREAIDSGAEVDERDAAGHTALMHAVDNGGTGPPGWCNGLELTSVLLGAGADVHAVGPRGRTALHLAALSGFLEGARALIEHGAIVDVRDSVGNTPLAHAVANDAESVVLLLLRHGADPLATNDHGVSPRGLIETVGLRHLKRCFEPDVVDAGCPYCQGAP